MSLPHGLLGLLRYKERTGYELAKLFEMSLNDFWHAQSSQIYRELNRLEDKGFVTSQHVAQQGKPNKRVYTITDAGQEEFMKWTTTEADLYKNRQSPLLLYTFFAASAPEVALQRLRRFRDMLPKLIDEQMPIYQDVIEQMKATTPNAEKEAVFWQMTHLYSKMEAEFIIKWTDEFIKILENLEEENLCI